MEIKKVSDYSRKKKVAIFLPEIVILRLSGGNVLDFPLNDEIRRLRGGTLTISFTPKKTGQPQAPAQKKIEKITDDPPEIKDGMAPEDIIAAFEEKLKYSKCRKELKTKVLDWLKNPGNREKTGNMSMKKCFLKACGSYAKGEQVSWFRDLSGFLGLSFKKKNKEKAEEWLKKKPEEIDLEKLRALFNRIFGRYFIKSEKEWFKELAEKYCEKNQDESKPKTKELEPPEKVNIGKIIKWMKEKENMIAKIPPSEIFQIVINRKPKDEEGNIIESIEIKKKAMLEALNDREKNISDKENKNKSGSIPLLDELIRGHLKKEKSAEPLKIKIITITSYRSFTCPEKEDKIICEKIRREKIEKGEELEVDYERVCSVSACLNSTVRGPKREVISVECELRVPK